MVLEHTNKFESQPPIVNQEGSHSTSFSSSTLGVVRRLNQSSDLAPGTVPTAQIGEKGVFFCCAPVKDAKETPEQRMDQKIKDCFGADVFDHLKDWDWLIENRKKLEDGIKKVDKQDAGEMLSRLEKLSTVDGQSLIYQSLVDGPTRGTLIPKRHDIYLRRGRFHSDDKIGQLYH